MFVYVLMLTAATPDLAKNEEPAPIRLPIKRVLCNDGTIARGDEKCRDFSPEDGVKKEYESFPLAPPIPSLTRYPMPKNNPGSWVVTFDYPSRSLAYEEEGTTQFKLTVGPDGKVSDCTITMSSGYANLDESTCKNITRRARFDPAIDNGGNPTFGYYSNRVTWRIPEMPSYAQQIDLLPSGPQATFGVHIEFNETDYPIEALEKGLRGSAVVKLTISEKGTVTSCSVATSTDTSLLDTRSCEIASGWKFLPGRDIAGKPIAGETSHDFIWILPKAWKAYQKSGLFPKKPVE